MMNTTSTIQDGGFAFRSTIAAGGLSGGITSTMAGGDFWDGVCNGLISAGLNHALHLVGEGGIKWVYRLHKSLSVPKQIGDMDCKYAVMEAVAKRYGSSENQSDFKAIGELLIKNNPTLSLSDFFRLCGFSVSKGGPLSLQMLEQMDQFDLLIGVEYMPNEKSDHIGVMTAFGTDDSNNLMIQLSDPYYGDNHIISAYDNSLLYYKFTGYQSITDMLNKPIKCLHYY